MYPRFTHLALGEKGVGGVQEDRAVLLGVGDAFEEHTTPVLASAERPAAEEDGDGLAGAVVHRDLERGGTGARHDANTGDLASDSDRYALLRLGDRRDIKAAVAVLEAMGVEFFDRCGETAFQVAKAHPLTVRGDA
jgi:hypothetical protein